jgi:hypothetical protein
MNHRIIGLAAALAMAATGLAVAPASAQQIPSTVTAEAECAPDGSTQGVVFTFVNNSGSTATIDFADAEGTAFADEDVHDLTFTPASVTNGSTATADLSFPGTASGAISVEVVFTYAGDISGSASGDFTITACAVPVTTTVVSTTTTAQAAAAAATAAAPSFTG